MLTFFKNLLGTQEPQLTKAEKMRNTIQQIHNDFYGEAERLLSEIEISVQNDEELMELVNRSQRLTKLGFTSSNELAEIKKKIESIRAVGDENAKKAELQQAINAFIYEYPNYKFITEESVIKLCKKYGLIYGPVTRYTGTVPEKNLKHIENFKIKERDMCFIQDYGWGEKSYVGFRRYEDYRGTKNDNPYSTSRLKEVIKACPLEIVAPASDFNVTGMEIKDFQLSTKHIPDPIVLHPIYYRGQKHYLIVTAWGLEASDDLVVNANHN